MNPQADNGVFRARMHKERKVDLSQTRMMICLWVSSCFLYFNAGAAPGAPSFHATGQLQYQVFGSSTNDIEATFKIKFEVDVDQCRWGIKAQTEPDNGHHSEMTYDGTNTYATMVVISTKGETNSSVVPTSAGYIKQEDLPFNFGSREECVWLGLASYCYLDQEKPGALSPAWLDVNRTESSLNGDRFRATIKRLDGEPRLPKSVACFSDGLIYGGPSGHERFSAPSPFDSGYLCFHYETLTVTNLDGLTIPLSSAADYFTFRGNATNASNVRNTMHVALTVLEVTKQSQRTIWQPLLTSLTRIEDFRFVPKTAGSVIYDTRGPFWPGKDAPAVSKALSLRALQEPPGQQLKGFVVTLMLIVTLIAGAALIYRPRQAAR